MLKTVVAQMEELFKKANNHFFDGKLQTAVVSVSPDMTSGAYGWCSVQKIWKDTKESYHEINMTAEYLNRPFEELCATMLHEMTHLWNIQNGVKDCSRGNTYHNKHFKSEAEKHGLTIEHHPTYGWTKTTLNEAGYEFAKENAVEFGLYRTTGKKNSPVTGPEEEGEESGDGSEEPKKKTGSRKYVCPKCGMIVRATKEVNVRCGDCDEQMIEKQKGEK